MSNEGKVKYIRRKDENGEDYLCPVDAASAGQDDGQPDLDECVDAATAGRYASNHKVIEQGSA